MFSTTIPMVLATKIPLTVKDMVIVWFERIHRQHHPGRDRYAHFYCVILAME